MTTPVSHLVEYAFTWLAETSAGGLSFKQGAEAAFKQAMKTAFCGADRKAHVVAITDLAAFLYEKKGIDAADQLMRWADAVLREPIA